VPEIASSTFDEALFGQFVISLGTAELATHRPRPCPHEESGGTSYHADCEQCQNDLFAAYHGHVQKLVYNLSHHKARDFREDIEVDVMRKILRQRPGSALRRIEQTHLSDRETRNHKIASYLSQVVTSVLSDRYRAQETTETECRTPEDIENEIRAEHSAWCDDRIAIEVKCELTRDSWVAPDTRTEIPAADLRVEDDEGELTDPIEDFSDDDWSNWLRRGFDEHDLEQIAVGLSTIPLPEDACQLLLARLGGETERGIAKRIGQSKSSVGRTLRHAYEVCRRHISSLRNPRFSPRRQCEGRLLSERQMDWLQEWTVPDPKSGVNCLWHEPLPPYRGENRTPGSTTIDAPTVRFIPANSKDQAKQGRRAGGGWVAPVKADVPAPDPRNVEAYGIEWRPCAHGGRDFRWCAGCRSLILSGRRYTNHRASLIIMGQRIKLR
jgi:DNA-directed RNA polymerase specialized sigma24 family protein